jgi:hypothetical protein
MEIAFLVVYAAILGLVAPYVIGKREQYGSLVPAVASLVAGSALWAILTWVGLKYDEGWIWVIVMLAMPAALFIATSYLAKQRDKRDAAEFERIRQIANGVSGKSKPDTVEYVAE